VSKQAQATLRTGAKPDPCPTYGKRGRRKQCESRSSQMYSKGKAVKYSYRIRGPQFPVKVIRPADSRGDEDGG
jgi:hypothetical protein